MPTLPSKSRCVLLAALVAASACGRERQPAHQPARTASAPIVAPTISLASSRTPAASEPLVAQQGDTGSARRPAPKAPLLTDAEQRVADGIVFAPRMTERFLAASRNKRLLVDVGRVDVDTKKDAAALAAMRRVSARIGPLSRATHLRVRGSWGEEVDSIAGYDVWNGRAVAVLTTGPHTDSLLRKNAPLVGVATRVTADSASAPAATPAPPSASAAPAASRCVRDSIAPALLTRATAVRDSLVRWMTDSLRSPFARIARATTVRGDVALGCFAQWRAIVVATSRTPSLEWNEERALLVAPDGTVLPARLRDLRLHAHESLLAFDADGDGIDELSTRGLGTYMGAQSILKLDPASRRFSRFASGFAWESR